MAKVKLYNFKTNQLEDVEEGQIASAVQSGQYGFKKGEKIPVVSPEGVAGTVPADNLQEAFVRGYQYHKADDREELRKEKEYGDRDLEQGLISAASGLTFGLSTQALKGTGAYSEEELKELQARNSEAALAGEIIGTGAGLLIPGAGVGRVGSLVKGASKVGNLTERAVAKGIEGVLKEGGKKAVAKEITKKIVPKVAGSAVEGSFYGAGHVIHEDALGNAELNAENLLAGTGLGAVFGGVAGGAFGALEATVPLLVKTARRATTTARESIDAGLTKLQDPIIEASAKLSGKSKSTIDKLVKDPVLREQALNARGTREAIKDDMFTALKEQADTLETLQKDINKTARPNEIEELLKDRPAAPAINESYKAVDDLAAAVQEMVEDKDAFSGAIRRQLNAVLKDAEDKVLKLSPFENSAADGYKFLDKLKRSVDKEAKWDQNFSMMSTVDQASVQKARDVSGRLRKYLEDENVWGEAGVRQQNFNEATSRFITAQKQFNKKFGSKTLIKGKETYSVSPQKVSTFINKADKVEGEEARQILQEYLEAAEEYTKQAAETNKSLPQGKVDVQGAQGVLKKTIEAQKKNIDNIALNNEVAALEQRGGDLFEGALGLGTGIGFGNGVDSADALTVGALGAYTLLKNPYRALQVLSSIEKASQKVTKATDRVVKTLKDTSNKATAGEQIKRVAVPVTTQVLMDTNFSTDKLRRRKPKDEKEAFKRVSDDITKLTSNPQAFNEYIVKTTEKLSAEAPKTAVAAQLTLQKAVSFLDEKMPKNPASARTLNPLVREWTPSRIEVAKFARYVQAVKDPLTVVEDFEKGVMSREGIEALENVYPALYESLRAQMTEKLVDLRLNLPYHERLRLSQFLNIPADASMEPETFLRLQETFLREPEQGKQGMGAVNTTVTGLQGMEIAENSRTETEKTQV